MTRAAPGYGLAMSEPQTVVVTGASAGVGRAVARAFGARGANVAVLARGFGSQQTEQPHDPTDPGNLFTPVDSAAGPDEGVHGAHGDLDDRARPRSLQLWASHTTACSP